MTGQIWKYFTGSVRLKILFLILTLSIFADISMLTAQEQQGITIPRKRDKTVKTVAKVDTIPLIYNIYVGTDLFGTAYGLFGGDNISNEISVAVNIKNRIIPSLELGMGRSDVWNDNGIHCVGHNSPYARFGLDINTMYKNKNKNNFLYAGLRYGMSSYSYSISSMPLKDDIFNQQINNPNLQDNIWKESVQYSYEKLKGNTHWLELVLGINIQVYRNINMGWMLRMKYKGKDKPSELGFPQYIPGYGKNQSNIMGVTYSIIYRLPISKSKKKKAI